MFKRILVTVDGSTTSKLALQQAIRMAKEGGAELRIVHVVNEVTYDWPEGKKYDAVVATFQEAGGKLLAEAEAEARKAGVTAAEADAWPADVIVIGTHGRQGMNRLLLGSVAEGVARVATTPVLLIRDK